MLPEGSSLGQWVGFLGLFLKDSGYVVKLLVAWPFTVRISSSSGSSPATLPPTTLTSQELGYLPALRHERQTHASFWYFHNWLEARCEQSTATGGYLDVPAWQAFLPKVSSGGQLESPSSWASPLTPLDKPTLPALQTHPVFLVFPTSDDDIVFEDFARQRLKGMKDDKEEEEDGTGSPQLNDR